MKPTLAALALALLLTGCASQPPAGAPPAASAGTIERLDPALDALVPASAVIEKLATGFRFTEGPVWLPSGVLWFSDVQGDVVRQWSPDGKVIEILRPGGSSGAAASPGAFIGPNGMINGRDGVVLLCQHGNRRIVSIDRDRKVTTLVDRFEGKRFNSPNDLVYRADGSLYFTDPPYGLAGGDQDKSKELPFNGVFRLAPDGKLSVAVRDLTRPNGIALSPDEHTLYVANSDPERKVWMRYDVQPDGSLLNGRVFFDVTAQKADGLPDGMKIDEKGNVFATGPGGVWIFDAAGKHLGTIHPIETPANCNWGDDGKTLYITARTSLYRIHLSVGGKRALY